MSETAVPDFHEGILEMLPDPIIWAVPVYDTTGAIEDFKIGFSNQKADEIIQHPKGSLTGLYIKRDGVPSIEMGSKNFDHFLTVFETGRIDEFTFHAKFTNSNVETIRRKYKDGVLSIVRDRVAQREAERKEQQTYKTFKTIVNNSQNGIVVYEAIRNSEGFIEDFKVKHYNERSNQLTGYTSLEREQLTFREILNGLNAGEAFDKFVTVVETGQMLQREQYVEKLNKWIISSTVKLDDGFFVMLTEVTELKQLQHSLQQQSAVTNSILDASLNGIYSLVAVRNSEGSVVDFEYLFVNSVIAEMLGKTADEVVGKSIFEIIPENRNNGFFELFCEVLQRGEPVRNQTHFITSTLDHWFDYVVVRMDENTLVVTLQDITKQKQFTLQLEQQKNLLDNILTYSSSGISVSEMLRNGEGYIVDARTILANDAAINYTGIPKDIYLSKKASELDPAIMESPFYKLVLQTLDTGEPFTTQYFLEPKGKWLETSVSKMDDDHIITVFSDITDRKQTQLQLEQYVEELKRTNANLEEFSFAASHDLKEPIRKVATFISQLSTSLEAKLDKRETQIMERVQKATARMAQLIDDLLDYSHLTFDSEKFEEVDLNEVINRVIDDLDLIILEKAAQLKTDKLPVLQASPRQLSQLFQNLISNALKYNRSDVPPEISITYSVIAANNMAPSLVPLVVHQQYHKISVEDNGIGFEQQYEDVIFQVFKRLHGKSEYDGTGVGLSIVKKVIQNHKGLITVESTPGLGSTFNVFLPAQS
jgi:PAS domain S-box-containing protein